MKVAATPKPALEQTKEYVELGEAIGKALSGTAKELGIAVNEFIKTPAGYLTVFIICWHLFGSQLIHLLVGGIFFSVAMPIWVKYWNQCCIVKKIWYGEAGKPIIERYDEGDVDGTRLIFLLVVIIIVVATAIIIFTG